MSRFTIGDDFGGPGPGQISVIYRWSEASDSRPGVTHEVCLLSDGSMTCDCEGFMYGARADGLCRHIDRRKGRPERAARRPAVV
jgi:hypothetical protein